MESVKKNDPYKEKLQQMKAEWSRTASVVERLSKFSQSELCNILFLLFGQRKKSKQMETVLLVMYSSASLFLRFLYFFKKDTQSHQMY